MEGSLLRQSQQIGPIRGFSKSQSQRTQRAGIAKATSPSSPFLRASVTHPDFPSKTMIRANDALLSKNDLHLRGGLRGNPGRICFSEEP